LVRLVGWFVGSWQILIRFVAMRVRCGVSVACCLLASVEAGWFGGKAKKAASGDVAAAAGGFKHIGKQRALGVTSFSLELHGTILDGTMDLKLAGDVQTHIGNG
jgi:hypothetical protein